MRKPKIIPKVQSDYRRILAIGDIHGHADHLRRLLDEIKPTREDLLVTLGDYIDRGPDAKGVIDMLASLHRDPEINIVSLRGNHDALMLLSYDLRPDPETFRMPECDAYYGTPRDVVSGCDEETTEAWWIVAGREPAQLWFDNQGYIALKSYCKTQQQEERLETVRDWIRWPKDYYEPLREFMTELIPDKHISFLQDTCVDALETEKFIFVHGGICPDLSLSDQPLFPLHWMRFYKEWKPHTSGKKVVCGHTPYRGLLIQDLGHAVDIDTGVYMRGGALTCMDVLSGQAWQIGEDLQPLQRPIVRYEDGRIPFVRISELPEGDQEAFNKWLLGRNIPFTGCAWPWDYDRWRNGLEELI